MQTILLLILILSLIAILLAILVLWILYDRSSLQRLKARRQRLLAEMPDTFVSYLTKNGKRASAKQLNVEIGPAAPGGATSSTGNSCPSPSASSSSRRSSPSPTNTCARSLIKTKRPIRLDQFVKYCTENSKDSNYGFYQEYELLNSLCKETVYKQPMLKNQNNKNRYANIVPYVHSIVKLKQIPGDEDPTSDYINANFIPGLHSDHEYIASQAPLRNTMNDFYRMILEHKVAIIVNLLERENPPYFPIWGGEDEEDQMERELYLGNGSSSSSEESDRMSIDSNSEGLSMNNNNYANLVEPVKPKLTKIKIKLDHVEQHDSFYIKKIFFIHNNTVIHRVSQFHYTKWVDFGTPDTAKSLLELVQAVRSYISSASKAVQDSPLLVHCSAGVGRTGTYIAVDQLWQMLNNINKDSSSSKSNGSSSTLSEWGRRSSKLLNLFQSSSNSSKSTIDIYGLVYRLRNWRHHLVQTENQYAFIYDCVRCILESKNQLPNCVISNDCSVANSSNSNSVIVDMKSSASSSSLTSTATSSSSSPGATVKHKDREPLLPPPLKGSHHQHQHHQQHNNTIDNSTKL